MTEDRFGWPYGVFYNRIVGILQLTEDDYTVPHISIYSIMSGEKTPGF
jgi:hypothetical protein